MDRPIRDKILRLLDEHRIMSLATVRPDGWPQATTVGYVNEGLILYFMCGRASQKAANIARENRVSLTIDHDTPSPLEIRGLSMAARAFPMEINAETIAKIGALLPKKYPEYRAMMEGVDYSQMAVIRVEPEVISVLDYSLGFGHTDLTTVGGSDREAA